MGLLFLSASGNMALMEEQEGEAGARRVVEKRMRTTGVSRTDLAKLTNLDPKTIRAFLDGSRWPQAESRRKIAAALGWLPDEIDHIVETGVHRGEVTYRDISTGAEYQKPVEIRVDSIETTELFTQAIAFPAHVGRLRPDLADQVEVVIEGLTALWRAARRPSGSREVWFQDNQLGLSLTETEPTD